MRQAQNTKRVRGRGGRKVVNQMSRTMDSNGPDVKIRGTASHIYEKYQALARDANSSGDRVMAENYLQHAEHYHRLINAMQAQSSPNGQQPQPGAQPGSNVTQLPTAQTEDSPQPAAAPQEAPAAVDPGEAEQPVPEKPAGRARSSAPRAARPRRRTAAAGDGAKKPASEPAADPELAASDT